MFTSIIRSHSSTLRRSRGACGMSPALLIMTSTRPYARTAASTSPFTWSRWVTSVATARALPPRPASSSASARRRSTRRAPSTTLAPCAERSRAVASPSPLLAPVMTTALPSMLLLIILTPAYHDGHSAIDSLLQMFRVPGSLHRDLGDGVFDIAEIVGCQLDARRSKVLVEAVQLRGAEDRNDPRLLGKQPGQRDLGTRRPLLGCDLAEHLDKGLIRLSSLRCESRNDVAEVGAV